MLIFRGAVNTKNWQNPRLHSCGDDFALYINHPNQVIHARKCTTVHKTYKGFQAQTQTLYFPPKNQDLQQICQNNYGTLLNLHGSKAFPSFPTFRKSPPLTSPMAPIFGRRDRSWAIWAIGPRAWERETNGPVVFLWQDLTHKYHDFMRISMYINLSDIFWNGFWNFLDFRNSRGTKCAGGCNASAFVW